VFLQLTTYLLVNLVNLFVQQANHSLNAFTLRRGA
jgi:hypothetical protein